MKRIQSYFLLPYRKHTVRISGILFYCCSHLYSNVNLTSVKNLKFFHKGTINWVNPLSFIEMDQKEKVKESGLLDPPACVKGMKILDRDAFEKTVKIPSLIAESEQVDYALNILKPYLLKMNKLKPVQDVAEGKLIYINPLLFQDNVSDIKQSLADANLSDIVWKEVKLIYDNWKADSILKAVLPSGQLGASGYSIVGHIVHLNLRENLNDFKHLIGQVLLDKISNVKTVVNKTNAIDSIYRNFKMEVLAGEPDFIVLVKENGFQYKFDFSEVFWNPRLSTEHSRVVGKLNSGDILYDVFAGVGPFAIPAAKRFCGVYANDLNPHSYEWLCFNSKLNKVDSRLKTYNLDGRDFIRSVIKTGLHEKLQKEETGQTVHIIMNLPAFAIGFLDAFKGLLSSDSTLIQTISITPVVHCYFFANKAEFTDEAQNAIEEALGCNIQQQIQEIVHVRSVAPLKEMMRVTFTLSEAVLLGNNDSCNEPQPKKIRLTCE